MLLQDSLPNQSHDVEIASHRLTLDALLRLVRHDSLVLRIPGFIDAETCKRVGEGLQREGYNDYLNAPSVGRIGMSYFETARNPDIVALYFKTAIDNIHRLRRACAPYQCPIDVFRCVADETWPGGAHLQELYGQKMFVGLSRNMSPGTPLLAHHDLFARHAPDAPEANNLLMQMAVNVYITVPEEGGELLIWRNEISDTEFIERREGKYGMALEPLGPADLVVKPMVGDLILFNARKLHAVAPGGGCDRLTVSCFLGYRGDAHPLTVWS
jgi:hypothetical protein